MAVRRFGQHHPGDERAQRDRQAKRVHQRRGGDHGEQPRDHEQFALAQAADQAEHRVEQQPPGGDQPGDRTDGVGR